MYEQVEMEFPQVRSASEIAPVAAARRMVVKNAPKTSSTHLPSEVDEKVFHLRPREEDFLYD